MTKISEGELNRRDNPKHRREAMGHIREAAKHPSKASDPFFQGRAITHYDNGLINIEDVRKGEWQ